MGRIHGTVQAEHPGRFVPGLGGAHGPRPLRTLGEYLDRLDDGPFPIPARARDTARGPVGFQRDVEDGYPRHFARMGFGDDDIAGLSDRMVDALVACGDVDAVAKRVAEQHAAGADHVALLVVPPDREASPMPHRRLLAEALLPA